MVAWSVSTVFANDNGLSKKEVLAYVDSLGMPPEYYEIRDVEESKRAFVEYLLPIIKEENRKIEEERSFVQILFHKSYFEWSRLEVLKLTKLAEKYNIRSIYNQDAFIRRIAPIPISLVLAQAAVESGWGRSRFVRDANNVFGHWTFGKLGIAPKEREPGKRHKLKLFKNINESVATYMLNLNRNHAYREFRTARWLHMREGEDFQGFVAAEKMHRYSEIGDAYVRMIKSLIEENDWHRYDPEDKV